MIERLTEALKKQLAWERETLKLRALVGPEDWRVLQPVLKSSPWPRQRSADIAAAVVLAQLGMTAGDIADHAIPAVRRLSDHLSSERMTPEGAAEAIGTIAVIGAISGPAIRLIPNAVQVARRAA